MGRLLAYNFMTLNGFYKGPGEDIAWNYHGEEEYAFSCENLKEAEILVFGRRTYELMAGFWTTKEAQANWPVVFEGMNRLEKLVFSKSLKQVPWPNSRLAMGSLTEEILQSKRKSAKNILLLGSGSLLTQLANAGLIDEYQFMIYPVAIREGTSVLNHLKQDLELRVTKTRVFRSGSVLIHYEPR